MPLIGGSVFSSRRVRHSKTLAVGAVDTAGESMHARAPGRADRPSRRPAALRSRSPSVSREDRPFASQVALAADAFVLRRVVGRVGGFREALLRRPMVPARTPRAGSGAVQSPCRARLPRFLRKSARIFFFLGGIPFPRPIPPGLTPPTFPPAGQAPLSKRST